MTVRELRLRLQNIDGDTPVVIIDSHGCFGVTASLEISRFEHEDGSAVDATTVVLRPS